MTGLVRKDASTTQPGEIPSGVYNSSTQNWAFGKAIPTTPSLYEHFVTFAPTSGFGNINGVKSIGLQLWIGNGDLNGYETQFRQVNSDGTFQVVATLGRNTGVWNFGSTSNTQTNTNFGNFQVRNNATALAQQALYVTKNTTAANGGVYISCHSGNNAGVTLFDIRWNGSTGAFAAGSDRRLKKDIEDLESTLQKLNTLRPVTYKWIDRDAETQIGFIAQEFREVFPDMVSGDEAEGMLSLVGWSKTEAILVKAIQELAAQNELLKQRIDALEGNT